MRQSATHVQEEEVEEGRNFKRYERQMERRSEWRKRERDRSCWDQYLGQVGEKPKHRKETDGRSPGEGTNYEIGMRTRTVLSNRAEGSPPKIGEVIGLEDRCWSVNPRMCTAEITREREGGRETRKQGSEERGNENG